MYLGILETVAPEVLILLGIDSYSKVHSVSPGIYSMTGTLVISPWNWYTYTSIAYCSSTSIVPYSVLVGIIPVKDPYTNRYLDAMVLMVS